MTFNQDLGKVGQRNDAAFGAFVLGIIQRIGLLPADYSQRAGQVPRVNPTGTGIEFVGGFNFATDPIRGGRFTHVPVTLGDTAISSGTSGVTLESHNGAQVTWTFSGGAAVGTVVEILQVGDGQVVPAVEAGAELVRIDLATRTRGKDALATMRVIGLNDGGKARWLFFGDTAA